MNEPQPIVKAFSPESVEGKHKVFGRFDKCPRSFAACNGPEPFFDDQEGGMCKECTLALQAKETNLLLCKCEACNNLIPMRNSEKTESLIASWREEHGDYELMPLDRENCPECSPRFQKDRENRELKRKMELEQAEAAYQESLGRKRRT